MIAETLKKWLCLGASAIKLKRQLRQPADTRLVIFDTSMDTDNLGDFIIMQFCKKALRSLIDVEEVAIMVPTHTVPTSEALEQMQECGRKIVCGTNILYPEVEHASIWKFPITVEAYKNCTLMGTGWGYYSEKTSLYSKLFYRLILDKERLHAVRDLYTWNKLREIGINNVIYTGCPTMWELTPEFCRKVPQEKGRFVLTTVTAYEKERELDSYMLECLCSCYEKVYAWPQGRDDKEYILSLVGRKENLFMLDRSMEAFEEILRLPSLDYVGTRLHGGVMALNAGKRSLIIATDNRAEEIGRDTNLPILNRNDLKENLKNRITGRYRTEVNMPFENINIWKSQFL